MGREKRKVSSRSMIFKSLTWWPSLVMGSHSLALALPPSSLWPGPSPDLGHCCQSLHRRHLPAPPPRPFQGPGISRSFRCSNVIHLSVFLWRRSCNPFRALFIFVLSFYEHLLTFLNNMLQTYLVFSLPLPWNQSFLQGTQFLLLGSYRRVKNLGTKCAHHCGVSPGAPEGRAGGKYTHTHAFISQRAELGEKIHSHTHTHTHFYICIYLCF